MSSSISPVLKQKRTFRDFFRRSKPYYNLHGSARFAKFKELRKMSLMEGQGVYVGAFKHEGSTYYLRHNGPEHILTFAPTRSGKGIGLVIPTLLAWEESAVILDIKGENWALTAGWRQKHANNLCLKFDPAAPEGSVKFNPLAEIRLRTEYEVADVQNIATMIVDPDGKGLNDHWAKTGYSLIVGTILHCLYVEHANGRIATILDVANCLADPESPTLATLQTMLDTEHSDGKTHPTVASCAREMMNKSENELSGVVSTAMSFLSLYRDPIVAKNTSVSEFKISDLMNHDRPVSLYLIVPPSDKDRLKPLLRLVINQIVRTLTRKMEFSGGKFKKSYKHRLLLMLDEFPSLGRLDIFQESLAFIAGYGLKAFLITQDLSQLYAAYGKEESIVSNCHIRIAYAPNKPETAKLLSEMLGTTTVNKKSISVSKRPGLFQSRQYSESWQEVQRPLLTPDECMTLPGAKKEGEKVVEAGDMLIFSAGWPAVYGKQILFFKDPVFLVRSEIPPPSVTDYIFALDPALAVGTTAAPAAASQPAPVQAPAAAGPESQSDPADTAVATAAAAQPDPADTAVAAVAAVAATQPVIASAAQLPVQENMSLENAKPAPVVAEVVPISLTRSGSTEDEPQQEGVDDDDKDGEAIDSEDQTDSLADFLP